MQNILFRADSSSTIGTGHIMRDLVLAEQFTGANIIFATQSLSGNINSKIQEKNYKLEILKSNNIDEVIELIEKDSIDMIVIDSYSIDYSYEKELKEKTGVKIFVLDDMYENHFCDVLLNHNIYADEKRYKELVPENCELRCGPEFTLLREEFTKERQNRDSLVKKDNSLTLFIVMGGADHSNKNIEILKVLENFSNIQINLVTTTSNQYLEELKEYVKDKKNITLHINTQIMAKLMGESDFAIVTPSVTLNEIFYMELPFIAIKTAENQNKMYNYLAQNNHLALAEFDSKKLSKMIEDLINSLKVELVNFTDLLQDEKKMVLEWRNNQNIRKWMFNQDEIKLEDHLKYIDSLKTKDDRVYFLVKQNKQPMGVIDFTDITAHSADIGIYSNPDLRGVGSLLMNLIIEYAFNVLKIKSLISEVYEENRSAIKLYNRFNFKEIKTIVVNNKKIICMELKDEDR